MYSGKLVDSKGNVFENDLKSDGYFLRGKLNGQGKVKFENDD